MKINYYMEDRLLARNEKRLGENKKVDEENKKSFASILGAKLKYVLEGGVIRVYAIDDEGNKKCIKSISIKDASPEILSKVEVTNIMDAMELEEVRKRKI